jgi:molybdenum cofactor guanylyltransferase
MGKDKALIPLGDKPLIEHVLERVQGLGTEVLITSNNPEPLSYLGIRLVQDRDPGAGALSGLLTALEAAHGDYLLIAACDMPFISTELFRYMLQRTKNFDVVIPYWNGYYEPMHAIYAKTCMPAVKRTLACNKQRLVSFFPEVRVLQICDPVLGAFDHSGKTFFNINTPQDFREAEHYLASKD